MKLKLIPGTLKGTWSVGQIIAGVPIRDPRCAPFMGIKEAEWILENEKIARERDSLFRNSSRKRS